MPSKTAGQGRRGKGALSRIKPLQRTRWYRDLCAEGIEPNPGPCGLSLGFRPLSMVSLVCKADTMRMRLLKLSIEPNPGPAASHQLSLLTLNVADSANAFEAAKAYMIDKVHVIALQEVCFSSQQAQAFVSQANRLGYHAFHVPGTTTRSRRGYDVHSGGVAVLVRHSIKVQPVRSWQGVAGQFVALDFGSSFMVAVYRRPDDDSVNDMTQALCETLWARRARQPWILLGDFNWTPEENEWLELLEDESAAAAGAWDHSCARWFATRWEGHRCIDYGITNLTHRCNVVRELTSWGDHIPIRIALDLANDAANTDRLQPTACYACSQGVTVNAWRRALDTAWQEVWRSHADAARLRAALPLQPNPDEESRIFHALVEAASRQAHAASGLDNAWRHTRPKGSPPKVVPIMTP